MADPIEAPATPPATEPKRRTHLRDAPMFWVTLAGFVAVSLSTIFAGVQAYLLNEQISYGNAPKVRVGPIEMWTNEEGKPEGDHNIEPDQLSPGMEIHGAVFIGETGGVPLTVASLNASDCRFYWSPDGKLPLVHPLYSHIPRGQLPGDMKNIGPYDAPNHQFHASTGTMKIGDQWGWSLDPITIPPGPGRLYVIGDVVYIYRDGRKIVMFARWFDPITHRFVPVDNPDYESAD